MFKTLIVFAVAGLATTMADAHPLKATDQPPEEVMGRGFKDWRKDLAAQDPSKRDGALRAILQFGPDKAYEAVPDILAMLKRPGATDLGVRDRGVLALTVIFLHKQNPDPAHVRDALVVFRTALKDPQAILRVRALRGLSSLGPVSRDALDDVVRLMRDTAGWEVRRDAIIAAMSLARDEQGKVHPRVISELVQALNDSASQVRLAALQALVSVGVSCNPQEKSAVLDRLRIAASRETDKVMKIHVLKTIAILDLNVNTTAVSVAPILKMLKDPEARVRKEAISALGAVALGALAAPEKPGDGGIRSVVLKATLEATRDADMDVAETALKTLIALRAVEALPHLEKLADDTKLPARLRDAADDAIYLLRMKEK